MAAAGESCAGVAAVEPRIVDLRQLPPFSLLPILAEETEIWRQTLDWDFKASAALVSQFQESHSLNGSALLAGGQAVGYSYYVCEGHKGLIGDFFVMRAHATPENEMRLLGGVVEQIASTPSVHRLESQLMMLRKPKLSALPLRRWVRVFPRLFLELDLRAMKPLPVGQAARQVTIDNWTERRQDDAAALVAIAYRDHIDSEINDQYRSPGGARHFLSNVIQYPGCGVFFQPGSFLAFSSDNGRLCGMCLSSLVANDVGHVTQICVSPQMRGKGVGYELLRRAIEAMARAGCRMASLTVTASNTGAIQLYEQVGFTVRTSFAAHVWDNF
ncbi:MAG TPA: GNAT family N-acetyltransferase [Bryobacteraceae bacterium]|jgi:ribosomal protein S18 acetylase RimI-like enzyme|nr:GNAT family N-acetyltransferase [Bryobacteraceae bacterium]